MSGWLSSQVLIRVVVLHSLLTSGKPLWRCWDLTGKQQTRMSLISWSLSSKFMKFLKDQRWILTVSLVRPNEQVYFYTLFGSYRRLLPTHPEFSYTVNKIAKFQRKTVFSSVWCSPPLRDDRSVISGLVCIVTWDIRHLSNGLVCIVTWDIWH